MKVSSLGRSFLAVLSVVVLLFAVTSLAAADEHKQQAPASHPSAPAAHPSAPAQHPTGGAAGQNRPGGTNPAAGSHGTTPNNPSRPGNNPNVNRPGGGTQTGRGGPGTTTPNRPGGAAGGGHQPTGSKTVALKNGGSATYRQNGQVRSIQSHGMTISHGMNGHRQIVANHNGRTVVAYGHAGGYTQRAYFRRGNTVYVQRTYVYGGVTYAYGYRSYYYGGYPYYGYAPAYYWGPAYYGWAYNPWPAPVAYGWGWGGAPWYGYYGAYYAPYPVYPSAAFWLTDFFLAASLQAAYAAQAQAAENGELTPPQFQQESSDVIASLWSSDPLVAANLASTYGANPYLLGAAAPASANGEPPLTKEIKDAIADEIKGQISSEKDAAANTNNSANPQGPPAALDPNFRYFVVANDEDLTTSDGTECTLTGGDVIYRTGDQPDNDKMVNATVKSSKKSECPVGATVGIEANDLQEMYNNMRQQMSQGMKEMANNSGKNGLPTAPDTKTTAGEVPAPTPDSNVNDDLQQTQKDADQAEAEAKQQSN